MTWKSAPPGEAQSWPDGQTFCALQEEAARKEKQQLLDVQRQVALESEVCLPLLLPSVIALPSFPNPFIPLVCPGELDSRLGWLASHRLPLCVGSARQPGGGATKGQGLCLLCARSSLLPSAPECLPLSALYLPRRLPPTSPGPSVFPSAPRKPQPPISTWRRPRRSTPTCWSQTGSSEESSRSFRPASWSWSPRWSCCRPRVRGCRSMSGGLNPCAPPPRRLPPAL